MTEKEIRVFVEGTMVYFNHVAAHRVNMGLPYPTGNKARLLDYTGAIGVTGSRKGCIYITSKKALLRALVRELIGDEDPSEETLLDIVGELANVVAGNAQKALGSNFQISVPVVITGKGGIYLPLVVPIFEIPFTWGKSRAYVVVG